MAYLALYRKYRPRTFDEVIGQDSITRILKNQIKYDRIGHAYLFSGIRGTGKTSLAKIFAKAINCPQNKDGNPCNVCEVCMNIDRSGVMDIIEIDGASNRGVDEIREIREKVKYPPSLGQYKVYIIDEVHMLTKEAFNALLKTLEEPPKHVVFILATTEPNKCPSTILSRCQRYEIKPILKTLIIRQMEKICKDLGISIDSKALDFVGSRGENSMRDALSLLDQIVDLKDENGRVSFEDVLEFTGMSDKSEIRKLIHGMISKDSKNILLIFREMISRGKDSELILDQVIDYLRAVLIVKTAGKSAKEIIHCTQEDYEAYIELSDFLEFEKLYSMIQHLIEEKNKLKYSSLQEIITEMAFLRLSLSEVKFEKEEKKMDFPKKNIQEIKEDRLEMPEMDEMAGFENMDDFSLMQEPVFEEEQSFEIKEPKEISNKEVNKEDLLEKSQKKCDHEKLFNKIYNEIGKTNPGQAMFLRKGIFSFQGENKFVINYTAENKNLCHFVNKQETIQAIEKVLLTVTGEKYLVMVTSEKESFSELNMIEKTKKIVNDDCIEIIEE